MLQQNHDLGPGAAVRLGAVSYLNSRPLLEGLERELECHIHYDVPSRLGGLLATREVDCALLPVVDLTRQQWPLKIVSDACIAADGPAMTVRVFSQVPPEQVTHIHVDGDSHTSVVLAMLIWAEMFDRQVRILPLNSADALESCQAALLIGDKVVHAATRQFSHELDLSGAWKELTGLPFVFAVWAAPEALETAELEPALSRARDRGVARSAELAAEYGPRHDWPVELAVAYLTRHIKYSLGPRERSAMSRFLRTAVQHGILSEGREWVFA